MILEHHSRKRDKLDIMADIISIILNENPSITRIMYSANLSYKLTRDYVNRLISLGLIEKRGKEYVATDQGIKFLITYSIIKSIIGERTELSSRILVHNNFSEILKFREQVKTITEFASREVLRVGEIKDDKIKQLEELKEVLPEELPGCGLWACGTKER